MFKVGCNGEWSGAGTIKYVAPEILDKSDCCASPALDVWSIGCIFYAMINGKTPFKGETRQEILDKINSCEYRSLQKNIAPT